MASMERNLMVLTASRVRSSMRQGCSVDRARESTGACPSTSAAYFLVDEARCGDRGAGLDGVLASGVSRVRRRAAVQCCGDAAAAAECGWTFAYALRGQAEISGRGAAAAGDD